MSVNEKLEQLLEQSYMDDYMMYTREDVVRFGALVLEKYGVNQNVDNHL
jgi:hypothetical protein